MQVPAAARKAEQRARARYAVENGEPLFDVSTTGLVDTIPSLISQEHARLADVLLELGRRGGASLRRK